MDKKSIFGIQNILEKQKEIDFKQNKKYLINISHIRKGCKCFIELKQSKYKEGKKEHII